MLNPFKSTTKTVKPKSRLETVTSTMLLLGCVVVIGSWLAPGLLGNLVKSSGKTFALLLLFLFLARAISARIGTIFGGPRS
ncbi:MAG: hypothetical protein RL173_3379 [Fibrobacterota bacterium]|jgi:hypothetical protein